MRIPKKNVKLIVLSPASQAQEGRSEIFITQAGRPSGVNLG